MRQEFPAVAALDRLAAHHLRRVAGTLVSRDEARTMRLLSNRAGDSHDHSNMRNLACSPGYLRLCDLEDPAAEHGECRRWILPHLDRQPYSPRPRQQLHRLGTFVLADRHRSDRQDQRRRGAQELGPVAHHHALSGRD